jgi:hypothetical protein
LFSVCHRNLPVLESISAVRRTGEDAGERFSQNAGITFTQFGRAIPMQSFPVSD